jgi:hypothetical protein
MTSPTVQISLASDGSLELHLPGSVGDRVIPLRETTTINPASTIRAILLAQSRDELGIGTDGAPTRQQLSHMERHQIFRQTSCPFCRSEDLREALEQSVDQVEHKSSAHFDARYIARDLGAGASVRRLPIGETAAKVDGRAKSANARLARTEARARAGRTSRPASDLGF